MRALSLGNLGLHPAARVDDAIQRGRAPLYALYEFEHVVYGLLPLEEVRYKGNHGVFFFWFRFGNHDGYGNQGAIVDALLSIFEKHTIAVEEIEEHSCCYSLVTIKERMVLHNEVQQVSSLFLQAGIDFFSAKALVNVANSTFEGIVFLHTKRSLSFPKRMPSMTARHSS